MLNRQEEGSDTTWTGRVFHEDEAITSIAVPGLTAQMAALWVGMH
jgi:hypothetical protein